MTWETRPTRMMSLPMLLLLAVAASTVPALKTVLVYQCNHNFLESQKQISGADLRLNQDRDNIAGNKNPCIPLRCKARKASPIDNCSAEHGY